MIIFIYQFRSQNLAIKDAAYQKAMDDYSDTIALLVQKPELSALVGQMGELTGVGVPESRKVTPEQGVVFGWMLLNYSLFERVYLLYAKK
jgi:hypothetical protein